MVWTSDEDVFTTFQEKGRENTTNTSLTISPLTPSTNYIFTVSLVTRQAGQGAEVGVSITTNKEIGGDIYPVVSTVYMSVAQYLHFSHILLPIVISQSSDKLAYFQTRILNIKDCEEWRVSRFA